MTETETNPYASENTGHPRRMSNPDGRPCATYHPETHRASQKLRWMTGGVNVTGTGILSETDVLMGLL